jgi:hypothetical protein
MASYNKIRGRLNESKWVEFFSSIYGYIIRKIDPETKCPIDNWQICRAEEVSQIMDNAGVDILVKDKDFPFNIQCKETTTKALKSKPIDIQPIQEIKLDNGKIPLLCTTVYSVKKGNKRRSHYGDFITIKAEDFEKIINFKNERNKAI